MILEKLKRYLVFILLVPLSIAGFLRKEFSLVLKKRKYLYLSIALPLILGLIYILTLTDSTSSIGVFVCDFDNTQLTESAFLSIDGFYVFRSSDPDCMTDLNQNIIDRNFLFGLQIQNGFTKKINNLEQAGITVFYDDSDPSVSSLASWKVDVALGPFKRQLVKSFAEEIKSEGTKARDKTQLALELYDSIDFSVYDSVGLNSQNQKLHKTIKQNVQSADDSLKRIESLDPNFLSDPIVTTPVGVHGDLEIVDVGIAPLFAVLSIFLLLMLCSTGVIYDRKCLLFARIRASNSSMFSYVISKLIFFFSISLVQFFIVVLIFLAFGARYSVSISLLIKSLIFISFVNTLIGFLIGLVSDTEGVSVLISLVITLPLLFLSGMFYPLEIMPKFIQWLANIMPLNLEILLLKKSLLFGGLFNPVYWLIPIGLFIICLFLLRDVK